MLFWCVRMDGWYLDLITNWILVAVGPSNTFVYGFVSPNMQNGSWGIYCLKEMSQHIWEFKIHALNFLIARSQNPWERGQKMDTWLWSVGGSVFFFTLGNYYMGLHCGRKWGVEGKYSIKYLLSLRRSHRLYPGA